MKESFEMDNVTIGLKKVFTNSKPHKIELFGQIEKTSKTWDTSLSGSRTFKIILIIKLYRQAMRKVVR